MQNKKKGIKKVNKQKNVSHHNKKKSQNKDKFSKNCNYLFYIHRTCLKIRCNKLTIKENKS